MFRNQAVVWAMLGLVAFSAPARAHPHVLVTATAEIVLAPGEQVTTLREVWTFDEMYTAFAITGFAGSAQQPSPEELHAVAQQNIDDLFDYNYFTDLQAGHQKAQFEKPKTYSARLVKGGSDEERLELSFTLPLTKPLALGKGASLRIYDPSYFSAFTFAPGEAVKLKSATDCRVGRSKPDALSAIDKMALTESFFTNMLPGTDFGVKMAEAVHIACP